MTKVVFVDIDGPMIPIRAYMLDGNFSKHVTVFDPVATAMVLRLVKNSGAKLVVSSTWRKIGYDRCMEVFEKNGIDRSWFHTDWRTCSKMSATRNDEILLWLRDHEEVTAYVALEDESLSVLAIPGAVKCDTYEGMSYRNYLEACVLLEAYDPERDPNLEMLKWRMEELIKWLKAAEIQRVLRKDEQGQHILWNAIGQLFPRDPPNKDPE